MRAATFAKQTGRTVSFALAAFRQAFAAGRDLSDPDNVLIAAAACELHPRALLEGASRPTGVKDALREATEEAAELGVDRRPVARRRRAGLLGRRPARGGGRAAADRVTVEVVRPPRPMS